VTPEIFVKIFTNRATGCYAPPKAARPKIFFEHRIYLNMARYEHLPIYRTAIDTAIYLQQIVRNFSRYDKYTIGADLRNISREILMLIIRANSTLDRVDVLKTLVENCEMLKTLIFFAKEAKALSGMDSFRQASGLAVSLCRQSQGWLEKSKKDRQNHPPLGAGR
jgi:hypothetical protein